MTDSFSSPGRAVADGDAEKNATQTKRRDIAKLRMHMKFIEEEIERHQATRKKLRAEMDALGARAKGAGAGKGAKKSGEEKPG